MEQFFLWINPFLHNAIWDAGELQGGRAVSLGWARAPSFAYIHTGLCLGPEAIVTSGSRKSRAIKCD